jgi:hypothetical protein
MCYCIQSTENWFKVATSNVESDALENTPPGVM